jgi:enoyl-CoA hydratase/carnithine racemase
MSFTNLRLDVDGRIAHLTFARPRRLNALSKDLLREIIAACEEVNRRDDVRVMVVSGEGPSFSAGFDLGDFASQDASPRESADLGRTRHRGSDRRPTSHHRGHFGQLCRRWFGVGRCLRPARGGQ